MQRTLILVLLVLLTSTATADSSLELDSHRGKVVLVDFWASWCIPCRRSFPWMNEMQRKYADDGLVIIAVNLDNDSRDAEKFLETYPAQFAIHYDPNGLTAREFKVQVMPTSVLIARNGEPVERHPGFKVKAQDEYEARIRHALNRENEL